MLIKDYIKGDKRGKEANRLEREALNDSFLQEALEGFENISGDHAAIVDRLEKKYASQSIVSKKRRIILFPNNKMFVFTSIAASILLLIIGVSAYLFLDRKDNTIPELAELLPTESERITIIDSPLPQAAKTEEIQKEMLAAKVERKDISAQKSSPPVIVMDERIDINRSDLDVAVAEEIALSDLSEALVAAESSEKLMFKEPEKQTVSAKIAEEKGEPLSEVVATGNVAQRKSTITGAVATVGKSDSIQSPFGEKEFQTYCKQMAEKNVCAGKNASVQVTFFIDEAGKPSKIEYKKYTCEKAKNEIEKLLASSPVWTKTNRKVTMTIKW